MWSNTEYNRRCIRDLEKIRRSLHNYFLYVVPRLSTDLHSYADELDKAYKDIKISKVAGQTGCVAGGILAVVGFGLSFVTFGASLGLCIADIKISKVAGQTGCVAGGILAVVGFGLSFVTFGASLGLCIAGGVIGGAGGITAGVASIADFVKARDARKKAEKQLSACSKTFNDILKECNKISEELKHYGDIEKTFPSWYEFWANLILGSGRVAVGFGWKMVAHTIVNGIRLGKGIDVATDVTSATVPLFRTLGTTMKGAHIAGGVASAVFLPIDVFLLVSNSVELHKNEAHGDSKRIREIVTEIQNKCLKAEEIDRMIDCCIAVFRH